ncbi:MAG: FHA domain-containing protein, partial [Oligoflexia bacterium]|nr:FHA domain-containing protein [Oligoflexia bacterium]
EEISRESQTEQSGSAQRVIIESGMRRPGKGSGLSFGAKKESAPIAEPPVRKEVERTEIQSTKPTQAPPSVTAPAAPKPAQRVEPRTPVSQPRAQQAQEEPAPVERREQRSQPPPQRQAQPMQRHTDGVKKSEAQNGRLFGWLVNYSNPDGDATELREGKFFVTASSLKTTDLILEDATVSTPHALCVVNSESGFQVQDLMSDRGVFVRRRGADSYQREYEIVSIEHGDWVRFGDVEFLVSLIAHVGAK